MLFNRSKLLSVSVPTRRPLPKKGGRKASVRVNAGADVYTGTGHATRPDGTPCQTHEEVIQYLHRVDPLLALTMTLEGPADGHNATNTLPPCDGGPVAVVLAEAYGYTLPMPVVDPPVNRITNPVPVTNGRTRK